MKTYTAVAAGVLLGLLSAAGAQASTYTYNLNLDNLSGTYPNYTNYVQVAVSQTASNPGQIQFTVNPTSQLSGALFMGFGFNFSTANTTLGSGASIGLNQITSPSGWSVNGSGQDDGFGTFQYNLKAGTGNNTRVSALTFDINLTQSQLNAGVGALNFVANSTKNTAEPAVPFVAHVANLPNGLTGYFGGPAPVPVPPALWLFGSGLVGLVGIARRRAKS